MTMTTSKFLRYSALFSAVSFTLLSLTQIVEILTTTEPSFSWSNFIPTTVSALLSWEVFRLYYTFRADPRL